MTKTSKQKSSGNETLYEMIHCVADEAGGQKLKIGDIVESLQTRGFGPLLLVPSLIGIMVGGIPGLNWICALMTILLAGQMLIGRKHPLLPPALKRLTIDRDKYAKAVDSAKPTLDFIQKLIRERLTFLVDGPAQFAIAAVCIGLAVSVIPLDILPFAAALPSAVIVILALGLTVHDGLVVSVGYAAAIILFLSLAGLL